MQTIAAYKGKVRALSFSADGAWLASAGGGGSAISVWNLTRGKRKYRKGYQSGVVNSVAFAPQGTALAMSQATGVTLWSDAVGSDQFRSLPGSQCAFRSDGAVLAVLLGTDLARSELHFLASASGEPVRSATAVLLSSWNACVAWSPTGLVLAVVWSGFRSGRSALELIRPDEASVTTEPLTLSPNPHSAAFSPDGRTLAVATTEAIHRVDVESATLLLDLKGHGRMINGVAYLPDGRLLSCSNDGTVRTWDGGRCVDVKDWQLGELTALAVARDGMRAAVGSKSGTILIWDID
jgi:WD40 repeat protein